jgi:putative phosphoesterase
MLRIGLISDTHGLLRPEALLFLRGCQHIVHAGDIGSDTVLTALREIAPVTAVRGNNDTGEWASGLRETQTLRLEGVTVFVLHDLKDRSAHPPCSDARILVCGHSHKPQIVRDPSGLMIINPGSAGPRRFKLPVSAAELTIRDDLSLVPRLVDLI